MNHRQTKQRSIDVSLDFAGEHWSRDVWLVDVRRQGRVKIDLQVSLDRTFLVEEAALDQRSVTSPFCRRSVKRDQPTFVRRQSILNVEQRPFGVDNIRRLLKRTVRIDETLKSVFISATERRSTRLSSTRRKSQNSLTSFDRKIRLWTRQTFTWARAKSQNVS